MSPISQDTQVKILAVALVATVIAAGVLIAWYHAQLTIKNRGQIRTFGVGAFSDPECTTPAVAIDWGKMDPGMSKAVQIYLKNNGTEPGVLSMNTSAWQPSSAPEFLTLTWNREGLELQPSQVVGATFVLAVSENVTSVTDFEFDTNIYLTGEPAPAKFHTNQPETRSA